MEDIKIKKMAKEYLEEFGQMTDHQDDYMDMFVGGYKASIVKIKELEKLAVKKQDDIDFYLIKNKQIESRLADAEKVISYYATSSLYNDGTQIFPESTIENEGGEKAREYQEKHGIKNE
jgi:hypothetical protein